MNNIYDVRAHALSQRVDSQNDRATTEACDSHIHCQEMKQFQILVSKFLSKSDLQSPRRTFGRGGGSYGEASILCY